MFIGLILVNLLFVFYMLYYMQMLQQHSYNENNSYYHFLLSDIKKNYKTYLLMYLMGIVLLLFEKLNFLLWVFYIFVMGVLILNSYINYDKHNDKKPLKFTKRVLRIMALDCLFFILLQIFTSSIKTTSYLGMSMLFISLNGFILIGVLTLLSPVEKIIFNKYKKMALNKINKMPNLSIIAITGSFGKTSTKMILESILKTTYKGFYTPASFNTPNGITMTINNEPSIFNDYFICEMGAKRVNEIKELCDLVHPKYGILTSIGAAHLESFKSMENIQKTKFELIESLPENGVAILNKDDSYQTSYNLKNNVKVIYIGIDNKADVMAKNIKMDSSGTSFTITFKDDNKDIKVNTVLLGNKNIYNILSCVALAKYMGVEDKQIIKGIKDIKPISHRLEIKKMGNVTIIDDAFNSNPNGAKMALEVLDLMENKKVIITPGMVEMGDMQYELNKEFGKNISKVADEVYLVGKRQTEAIYDGLNEKKYNKENIFVCSSFKEAYNLAIKNTGNKKTTILIENDLPDSYTEE